MRPAAFLDRDGVINAEVNYLHEPDRTVLLPGVAAALRRLREAGLAVVVVTNQAGVAKGYYPESDVAAVHRRIAELLAREGAAVDAFYHCPHHPDYTGPCDCRKPAPGMLLRAVRELGLDPARSMMAGDRASDLAAGRAAGCAAWYLVRTGYGEQAAAQPETLPPGTRIAADLAAAADDFLKNFPVS